MNGCGHNLLTPELGHQALSSMGLRPGPWQSLAFLNLALSYLCLQGLSNPKTSGSIMVLVYTLKIYIIANQKKKKKDWKDKNSVGFPIISYTVPLACYLTSRYS